MRRQPLVQSTPAVYAWGVKCGYYAVLSIDTSAPAYRDQKWKNNIEVLAIILHDVV